MDEERSCKVTGSNATGAGGPSSSAGGDWTLHRTLQNLPPLVPTFLLSPTFFERVLLGNQEGWCQTLKPKFETCPFQSELNTWPRRSIENISRKGSNTLTQQGLSHRAGRTARDTNTRQGFGCHWVKRPPLLHPGEGSTE